MENGESDQETVPSQSMDNHSEEITEEYYNTNYKKRGIALIFNHIIFDAQTGLKKRHGTNKDSEALEKELKKLDFTVKVHNNLKYDELKQYLEQAAAMDHSDFDCFCVTVMTHGKSNGLYAKDKVYKPRKLWSCFTPDKCRTLKGKPKLFFVQACSGSGRNMPISLQNVEHDGFSEIPNWPFIKYADFLIVNATAPGFLSIRIKQKGSWFIQTLCQALRRSGSYEDILSLVTTVLQGVALDHEVENIKQIPCFTSTLTRLLVFEPKNKT